MRATCECGRPANAGACGVSGLPRPPRYAEPAPNLGAVSCTGSAEPAPSLAPAVLPAAPNPPGLVQRAVRADRAVGADAATRRPPNAGACGVSGLRRPPRYAEPAPIRRTCPESGRRRFSRQRRARPDQCSGQFERTGRWVRMLLPGELRMRARAAYPGSRGHLDTPNPPRNSAPAVLPAAPTLPRAGAGSFTGSAEPAPIGAAGSSSGQGGGCGCWYPATSECGRVRRIGAPAAAPIRRTRPESGRWRFSQQRRARPEFGRRRFYRKRRARPDQCSGQFERTGRWVRTLLPGDLRMRLTCECGRPANAGAFGVSGLPRPPRYAEPAPNRGARYAEPAPNLGAGDSAGSPDAQNPPRSMQRCVG